MKPAKEKKKKKKGGGAGANSASAGYPPANPFGFGGGFGGGLPGGSADPFADLMGGGGGGGAWAPPQLNPEQQAAQARQFETQMQAFNEQMTQMFKDIPPPDPESQAKMQASMAETLRALSGRSDVDAAAGATNEDGSERTLSAEEAAMKRMFESAESGQNAMQGMMDTMLQHLLSKDVLYEPMKEIAELYPPWLEKNGKKIPDEELRRFESQLAKTRSIIAAFEDETVEHAEIVRLLQEMQSFGNPPEEIMKEMANKKGMKLDANGVPQAWGLGGGGAGGGSDPSAPAGLGGLGLDTKKKGKKGGSQGPPPECSIM